MPDISLFAGLVLASKYLAICNADSLKLSGSVHGSDSEGRGPGAGVAGQGDIEQRPGEAKEHYTCVIDGPIEQHATPIVLPCKILWRNWMVEMAVSPVAW